MLPLVWALKKYFRLELKVISTVLLGNYYIAVLKVTCTQNHREALSMQTQICFISVYISIFFYANSYTHESRNTLIAILTTYQKHLHF